MDRSLLDTQQPEQSEFSEPKEGRDAGRAPPRRRFVAPRLERHAPLTVVIAGSFDLDWN